MVSDSLDSVTLVSSASNSMNSADRNRANRSATSRQWRRDASRKKWLPRADVKESGLREDERNAGGESWREERKERDRGFGDFVDSELRNGDAKVVIHYERGSEAADWTNSCTNFADSCSASSSSSTADCCSGNITVEEDGEEKYEECLEDLDQHFFDALSSLGSPSPDSASPPNRASQDHENITGSVPPPDSTIKSASGSASYSIIAQNREGNGHSRQLNELENVAQDDSGSKVRKRRGKRRAMQPGDDSIRQSPPQETVSRTAVSSECPICCEDMDETDVTFFPCECKFQPCLFCLQRILEEDERCPSCRRLYNNTPSDKPKFRDEREIIPSSNPFQILRR